MLSLRERLEKLEKDLLAIPPKISAYHDLPFAIFHYPPRDEFKIRKEIKLLMIRLKNAGKHVRIISIAKLFWQIIKETEGIETIIEEEKKSGFSKAQEMVSILISDEDFKPLSKEIANYLQYLNPEVDICFLVRVGILSPAIYRCSVLLDEMHKYKVKIPTILFYPGNLFEERELQFLNLPMKEESGAYNYRVKIY